MLSPMCLLWPFAVVYDAVTSVRNLLFDNGILPERQFDVPVIAVGNLAVGGTGKTPHTEYLIRLLKDRNVAMLSRGYGRQTKGYRLATGGTTAEEIGDEPFQIKHKMPDCIVAVDEQRCRGIERIRQDTPADVVVLDDAFQHRHVKAGLYILLTDFARLYCHDWLMPAGRLRESARGAKRADIIIVTKCPPQLTEAEQAQIVKKLSPRTGQKVFFTTFVYGSPYPLFPEEATPCPDFKDRPVLTITGIARPAPLYAHLESQGAEVKPRRFADHHHFSDQDLEQLNQAFEALGKEALALTTEKDAARFLAQAPKLSQRLRRRLYVQPIEVRFIDNHHHEFNHIITDYASKD
ncbi:MAG: tetraacyldisaccharide 4'-kinase [Alloprevotella sp.]